ncbi:hypothetical protein Pint_36289 [Pistacia integerrima]|uniref:Uncharacterized protein n=1 Tax=Pistacia integerrima TaxID=434235 RepID=A0ACC0Y5Q4_9ROSI|nr:hypothetical protein Pint_36289 [Pistacia integerrima]
MKLVSSRTILESIKLQLLLGNFSRISSYSTAARNLTTEWRSWNPYPNSMRDLFRRITPLGDPTVSIVPLLDQWVQEGQTVEKEQLQLFIKELRSFRRFTHALQISMWMTDKRYLQLTAGDFAIRSLPVYSALINCYANAKFVEKAEATMQEISDLGLFAGVPLIYNSMLNLYYKTGNYEKFDSLIREMEEKGIGYNKMTFCIRLNAYAATSDVEGIDKIVNLMESYPTVLLDWEFYATAASGYAKAGFLDKSLQMLKKSEGLISGKSRFEAAKAYEILIRQKGLLQKAESLISKEKLKGGKLDGKTWFYMATGYLKNNQTLEAVEAMKEASVVCRNKWKPSKEHLASSLTFLNNGVEDIEGVEKFINLLREKDIISEDLQEKWLNNVQNGKLNFDALSSFYVDGLIDDAEALSAPEVDNDDSVKAVIFRL